MVHNQTDNTMTVDNGIAISPGYDTYVAIDRIFTTHLEMPYSTCQKDLKKSTSPYLSKLFKYFAALGITHYDQKFCFKLCSQDQLLSKCGCIDISTSSINKASYCANDAQIECLKTFISEFTTSNIMNTCMCPQQCESEEFVLTTTSAKFPTYTYLQNLATDSYYSSFFPQNISLNDLILFSNIGFVKLTINYKTLYYTSYEDHPVKTPSSLVGDIGGQLGTI